MRVFDVGRGDSHELPFHAEPAFTYLNRSGRPEMERVREVIETWFAAYPGKHQGQLLGSLRSRNDLDHLSAYFELFLHALLSGLGFQLTVHPQLPNTSRRPDFLLESATHGPIYMEARLVSGESKEAAAARARQSVVYDCLDEHLESPDFFVGLEMMGARASQPPAKRIREFLREKLSGLDWDSLSQRPDEEMPRWRFEHDGWEVDFVPIAKTADARGEPNVRPLALFFHDAHDLHDVGDIRRAVVDKGKAYGEFDAPYVVALNSLSRVCNEHFYWKALLGDTTVEIAPANDGSPKGAWGRALNGAWTSSSGPRYTRMSGVLGVELAKPWHPAREVCFYPNPWAQNPLSRGLPHLSRFEQHDEQMVFKPGDSARKILGLGEHWPEQIS